MTDKILNEYVHITNAIENIKNKINNYKNNIINSIEESSSEDEQKYKVREFQSMMEKIKSDPSITKKYKILKERQEELRKILIPNETIEINNKIIELKFKYQDNLLEQNNKKVHK